MRNPFLALLLINLFLVAWYWWIEPASHRQPELGDSGLALYEERGAGRGAGAFQANGSGCFRIGPWADDAATRQMRALLAGRGVDANPEVRDARTWLGHWVRLDGFASTAAAEAARSRLTAGGLTDAMLMQEGDNPLISLGVFRERERADRVVAQAEALGFRPSVQDRFRPGVEHWLLIRPRPGQAMQPEDLPLRDELILRSEPAPCGP